MIKRIFILWLQGFDSAPCIVKKCIESWKLYNPSWKITLLHDKNLHKYIDISVFDKGKFPLHKIVDVIRVMILKKYGGLWCNATLFCNKCLDDWLYEYIEQDFFMCRRINEHHFISPIFMYSTKDNEIINTLYNKTLFYYHINSVHDDVFLLLYKTDRIFLQLWNKVPQINIETLGVYDYQIMPKKKRKSPFYKLNYNPKNRNELDELFKKINVHSYIRNISTHLYVYNYKKVKPAEIAFKYF